MPFYTFAQQDGILGCFRVCVCAKQEKGAGQLGRQLHPEMPLDATDLVSR